MKFKVKVPKVKFEFAQSDKFKYFKKFLTLGLPILVFTFLFVFIMDKTSPSNVESSEFDKEQLESLAKVLESPQEGPGDFEELVIEDIEVGTGVEVKEGDTIRVHYTGTLINGTKFDSSLDRSEPFEFTVGEGAVIAGWEQGILGMKVGGERKLSIPSSLGYGQTGSASIPPNSGLIFEVEVIEILES